MNDSALIEFVKQAIADLIALYRFGSQTTGSARPESDVDLSVLARHPIPALRRFELVQELAVQLHRDVNLVDLRSTSTVMRMQVVSTGDSLFTVSDRLQGEFEDLVYSTYARLNEERREFSMISGRGDPCMPDDVVINKVASLERCIERIAWSTAAQSPTYIRTQDSILLNLQRACEVSIDLAMHVVRKCKLGVPQDSRDAFDLLQAYSLVDEPLATAMKRMVGFRNIAIHEYDKLNLNIVKSIIITKLDEILKFGKRLLQSGA